MGNSPSLIHTVPLTHNPNPLLYFSVQHLIFIPLPLFWSPFPLAWNIATAPVSLSPWCC